MRDSGASRTIRKALTTSMFESVRIARSGQRRKYTAPPPKNGSRYVLKLLGKYGANCGSNCPLPPAHLRNGAAAGGRTSVMIEPNVRAIGLAPAISGGHNRPCLLS